MLNDYLISCWLSPKEIELYLKVFQQWPKTATQLAYATGIERTNCYKIIQKLITEWLIQAGEKNGVKQFRVEKPDSIKTYLEHKKQKIEKLEADFDSVEHELQRLRSRTSGALPKIRLFEQQHGLDSLYESMSQSIKDQWVSVIQLYASDTLESSWQRDTQISKLSQAFYENIQKQDVKVELRKGIGINLIEQINHSQFEGDIKSLSHGSGASQLRIIWSSLFIIMFKDIPVGMKIESGELSYMIFALLQKI